jgi:RNA polymerase sigma-70 factor, ECF subfamily
VPVPKPEQNKSLQVLAVRGIRFSSSFRPKSSTLAKSKEQPSESCFFQIFFRSDLLGQTMISIEEFNGIYRQHVDAVFRVTLRSVSRREIAEEITSEVFLTFYQNAASLSSEQLPAWLFTVAKRRAADYWRRWYLEERWSLEDTNESTTFTPEYSLEDLLAKCDSLKPIHRVCVILRFAHGMSRTEIAQQTGLSELQVKGNLQYALKLLRDALTTRTANLPPTQELSADV